VYTASPMAGPRADQSINAPSALICNDELNSTDYTPYDLHKSNSSSQYILPNYNLLTGNYECYVGRQQD
jgi:hypothetical protein